MASVVSENAPANCAGPIGNGGGNVSFPETSCPGQNADPLLGPLRANGGLTFTRALGTGSAAIDAVATGRLPVDQRGVARPQGPACDAGAFEVEVPPLAGRPGGPGAPGGPGDGGGGGPSAPDTLAPAISAVSLTNRVFAVGSGATALSAQVRGVKRGTTFRYTLSEAATVRFTIRAHVAAVAAAAAASARARACVVRGSARASRRSGR